MAFAHACALQRHYTAFSEGHDWIEGTPTSSSRTSFERNYICKGCISKYCHIGKFQEDMDLGGGTLQSSLAPKAEDLCPREAEASAQRTNMAAPSDRRFFPAH